MTVVINGTTGISPVTASGTSASVDGMTVGRGAGSVSTNTAVGASALNTNSTGSRSTALGYQAAYTSNAEGITAVGHRALYANTTGVGSVAIGASIATVSGSPLESNTTGSYNTAVGTGSLGSNTTASGQTAVGYQAAYAVTTAGGITAVGYQALTANTSGSLNVALGGSALASNTTASNNTAVGYQAGYSNTTSGSNVFIGDRAGYTYSGTLGSNTIIGQAAGYSLTTGSYNTFIGNGSGYPAGYFVTTGSKNTIIGSFSGNQGGLDIRTSSNYIVLSDGDGNPSLYGTGAGVWTLGTGGSSSAQTAFFSLNGSSATNYGPVLRYANNGTYLADVGDYANIATSATHQFAIRCGGSGGVYLAANSSSWGTISDETQKNIIEPITDGLNKVASLRAVIGSYKSDEENTRHPFLIAQDVQSVLPEAVTENEHEGGTILGLAYTEVIPLLVAAIKELKAEIDTLKGN